jgi:hypothetical protein
MGPWYRQRPRVAVTVAALLFAGVFALRLAVGGSEDAISMLYVLPIALVSLAFGAQAGVGAGVCAVALVEAWAVLGDVDLTPVGWLSRATPLLLLGLLVGVASDQQRIAARRDRELAAVLALQREAAEINDTIVQGLAASKWRLECGDVDRGLATLTETMATAQALVSSLLGAASPLPGDLRRSRPPVPRVESRAVRP